MAIVLTKSAAERVRTFLDKDGGVGLRLGVRKTGCSGWAYTVQLAEDIQEDDIIFENDGVKVVVSPGKPGFSRWIGNRFRVRRPWHDLSIQQPECH